MQPLGCLDGWTQTLQEFTPGRGSCGRVGELASFSLPRQDLAVFGSHWLTEALSEVNLRLWDYFQVTCALEKGHTVCSIAPRFKTGRCGPGCYPDALRRLADKLPAKMRGRE